MLALKTLYPSIILINGAGWTFGFPYYIDQLTLHQFSHSLCYS